MRKAVLVVLCAVTAGACTSPSQRPVRVASAANFFATAQDLAARFEAETGARVDVISGSTGKHVAQIREGAPFDLLLAADTTAPRLVGGLDWIYARGILVAWSPGSPHPDSARALLKRPGSRVAVANPALAPYGLAAEEVLAGSPAQRIRGENVSQAFQFAAAGGADVALVAMAQLPVSRRGDAWRVPDSLHSPILQGAAVLKAAGEPFAQFMQTEGARRLIREAGYTEVGYEP